MSDNTASDISIESIKRSIEGIQEWSNEYNPDIYITTLKAKHKLMEYLDKNKVLGLEAHPQDGFSVDRLYGIPFEVYPTLKQCHDRIKELHEQAISFVLICD